MNEEQVKDDSKSSLLVSFRAYPIETAPKDRSLGLFIAGAWYRGEWNDGVWDIYDPCDDYQVVGVAQPTAWAELSDMVPIPEQGNTTEGDSSPVTPCEAKQIPPTEEESREAFEDLIERNGWAQEFPPSKNGACYIDAFVQHRWIVWQACNKWRNERNA